jgi:serine/threonine-protein kinase
MGAVYEGRHRGTGRRVAVKIIVGDAVAKGTSEVVRRFQREAMATGAIESQYIAHALDTGVDPASGAPYLVMDLLTGEDLQQTLERLGPLAPDVALRVAAQACLGLQKAHEAGVVHRDIKPGNLFLTRRERDEVIVKILDFGIAKVKMDQFSTSQNMEMTRTGSVVGTPLYMSPEQARGKKGIDHRTDLWSLGVVLYEALTGRTPHGSPDTIGDLIVQICAEEPHPLQDYAPWVPPEAAAIVQKALAREASRRFASATEMFDAIAALLPQGDRLDVAAFVPLSDQARSRVAPKLPPPTHVPPPPSSVPIVPSGPMPSRAISDASHTKTMAGFASSPTGRASTSRGLKLAAAALLATVAIAGVLLVASRHERPTIVATSLPTSVAPSVAPSASVTVPVVALESLPSASASAPMVVLSAPMPPSPPLKRTPPPPVKPAVTPAVAPAHPPSPPPPPPKKPADDDLYKP